MSLSKLPAFGLDLSDLSIKLAWLKKNNNQIKLAGFNRQEIPEGVIESGLIKKEEELISLIKKTVLEAKGEKIKTKNCIVSLPETESYVRVVQLPKMQEEEIQEAIKWELEANIPIPIDDIYFDWQVIGRGAGPQDHLDILIGALPKVLVDPYLSVIKKTGLDPLVFEIESVATGRALIKKEQCLEPVMIIDIGGRRSSLIIFCGDTIWLTTGLPASNSILIEEIAKNLKITLAKAKSFKIKIGLDPRKEGGAVYRAMVPKMVELVAEIKKYLDYYQTFYASGHGLKPKIERILLCGGGANLKGLAAFLSSYLKVEVEVGNPWVNIFNPSTSQLPDIPFEESLSYATTLGLALRGVDSL
jgi:type IV pilus assembly protein PilM